MDTLVYDGTAGDDTFNVAAATGAVTLNRQLTVSTPGVANLTLNGLGGNDTFVLHGSLPYTATTVSGDSIMDLSGATGPVTVNLADSTMPTNTTITGYGGTVTLIGVDVANLDANSRLDVRSSAPRRTTTSPTRPAAPRRAPSRSRPQYGLQPHERHRRT